MVKISQSPSNHTLILLESNMNVQVISIHRKNHVPRVPAPFLADGMPTWSAVLPSKTVREPKKYWEEPGPMFRNDIESVFVNGKKVF